MSANNPAPAGRAVVASTVFKEAEASQKIGLEAYSYPFVARAFLPLLADWGATDLVTQPESRLDHALWRMRQAGREPLHLSFTPLHTTYLTAQAPTVCFPFWEYPDVPDRPVGSNLRTNWAHVANRADMLLTACTFTRQAFERAGVRTPVHVVPVPVRDKYFCLPAWEPGQSVRIDCPCYVFPQEEAAPPPPPDAWLPQEHRRFSPREWLRALYLGTIRPRMPGRLDVCLTLAARAARKFYKAYRAETVIAHPVTPQLDLSGIVFTTILNPFDKRKNLDDLLSAFLLALADRDDATLVVKLVLSQALKVPEFNRILGDLRDMGIRHRCRLVFITDYLTDAQMVDLARASAFYVTATRAEGACLPLQEFLAAGRPGVAPTHTALADYFGADVGLPVASHPEPTWWPTDPEERLTTTWHRPVWQSLFEQVRAAYALAKDAARYRSLGEAARVRMWDYASGEAVKPRLAAALDTLVRDRRGWPLAA